MMTDEDYLQFERDRMDEYDMRFAPAATQSEAHYEWHRNSGVPLGEPGCPQDACHPPEPEHVPSTQSGVKCGNQEYGNHWEGWRHHASAADVRECYETTKGFTR